MGPRCLVQLRQVKDFVGREVECEQRPEEGDRPAADEHGLEAQGLVHGREGRGAEHRADLPRGGGEAVARRADDRRVDLDWNDEGRGVGPQVGEEEGEPKEYDEQPAHAPHQHVVQACNEQEEQRHGHKAPQLQPVPANLFDEEDAEDVAWDGHAHDDQCQDRLVPHLLTRSLGLGLEKHGRDLALERPCAIERDVQEEPRHRRADHRPPELPKDRPRAGDVPGERGGRAVLSGRVRLLEHGRLLHLRPQVDHCSGRHGSQGQQGPPGRLQRQPAEQHEQREHAGEQHAPALHREDRGEQAAAGHAVRALGSYGRRQRVLTTDTDAEEKSAECKLQHKREWAAIPDDARASQSTKHDEEARHQESPLSPEPVAKHPKDHLASNGPDESGCGHQALLRRADTSRVQAAQDRDDEVYDEEVVRVGQEAGAGDDHLAHGWAQTPRALEGLDVRVDEPRRLIRRHAGTRRAALVLSAEPRA
mmetsp:Transcript_79789/g.247902  ORF Transcript_79789/g.247902 Transcript_79789/m.247902 type:complete len:477 (+) Transcript_79789:158-1588(+)